LRNRVPLPLFARLPRGLKLVMVGMVLWLIATVPLLAYLLLARMLEQRWVGPGLPGVIAFALNMVAAVLVLGGLVTWLLDGRRSARRSDNGGRA
jgi:hypothetical protein